MEGGPEEVACLTLGLDMGDLSGTETGWTCRRETLQALFGDFPGVVEELLEENRRAFARLDQAAEEGTPLRLWVGANDPGERCGLCYVCHRFQGMALPLTLVEIPCRWQAEGVIREFPSAGDVPPEALGGFAKTCGRLLTEAERDLYAKRWQELVQENAPLRAMVNGRLMSVAEDFYDFVLRASLPEGEFVAAKAIGQALTQLLGVGDRWLFLRMQRMLAEGTLAQVRPPREDHPYSAVLRRADRNPAGARPRAPVVDHIHITVENLERAEGFYDELLPLLGFDLAMKERDCVQEHQYRIVEYHNQKVSIGLVSPREAYIGQPVSRRRPGALHHLAFYAENRAQVDGLYQKVLEMGATILHPPRLYPEYAPEYYAFFFKDTEGAELEIVHWKGSGKDGFSREIK